MNITGIVYAAGASLNVSGGGQVHLYGSAAAGISAWAVVDDVSVSGNGVLTIDASQNAPLLAGIAGGASSSTLANASVFAVSGQPLVNIVAGTSSALASTVSYTAEIDWGDGSPIGSGAVTQTAAAQYAITGSHVYVATGTYQIDVTLSGSDGSIARTLSTAVISDTALEPDPTNPATSNWPWAEQPQTIQSASHRALQRVASS